MSKPFAHLHVHSDFSQLDGCSTVKEYVEEAERRGDLALAITEHGSIRSFYELHAQTSGTKVKPVFGIEFYLAMDARQKGISDEEKAVITRGMEPVAARSAVQKRERELGVQGRYHLTAWATTEVGLSNLFRLSSQAWTSGFYYRPRIDPMALVDHGEGIVLGSACLSSPFYQLFKDGNERKAFEMAQYFCDTLGAENLVFELMPHALADQVKANQFHIEIAHRFGCKLIATQDAHYLRAEDAKHHEVLLAIGTGKSLNDLERFKFDKECTFHFKTWEEMVAGFQEVHGLDDEWCDHLYANTMELAERCNVRLALDRLKGLLPAPALPPGYRTPFGYLQALCVQGWERRRLHETLGEEAQRVYRERLKYELGVLRAKKFEGYFLMVQEMFAWAKERGILTGPGRGSSAGSLVAYLLGITAVDPIQHGLYFERFINPDRIDYPDIDCDFEDRRRVELIEYLGERYGENRVCRIATFGTLAARQAVKDVARTLDVPFSDSNRCTAAMVDELSLQKNFEEVEVCREFAERYPEVLGHAERLEGFVKNIGIHAAGMVVSPVPLIDVVPLETRDHKGVRTLMTAVDMRAVQELGLVKLDILGLKTLTLLKMCCEAVQEQRGESIQLEEIPLDDPDTLAGFSEHDFDGVFQFDTHAMRKVAGKLVFESFAEVAVANAVNRPGLTRSGLAQDYIDRKNNPKERERDLFAPEVTALTTETYGVIVYQEQVISILVNLAGFTAPHADLVRKKIGKSAGKDELEKFRAEFVIGVTERYPGIDPEITHRLMDALIEFGEYAFNKAHSIAYSMIAFWCMYLKRHYPLEYFWAMMSTDDDTDKQRRTIRAARRRGVSTLPADVNVSSVSFSIDKVAGVIRGSLVDIKQVGDAAAQEIMRKQPYTGIVDFLKRTERKAVNRRSFATLLQSGAFDTLVPNVKRFIEDLDSRWRMATGAKWAKLEVKLKWDSGEPDYDPATRVLLAIQVNPLAYGAHLLDPYLEFISERLDEPLIDIENPELYRQNHFGYALGWTKEVKAGYHGMSSAGSRKAASVFCENQDGAAFRVYVPWHVYGEHREKFDDMTGLPLLFYVKVDAERQSLDARMVVDLSTMKTAFAKAKGKRFSIWERIAFGRHPAADYGWKKAEHRARAMQDMCAFVDRQAEGRTLILTGVVTSCAVIRDKKGQEMAFVGLKGRVGFCEVTCFSRAWLKFESVLRPGAFVSVKVQKEKRSVLLDEGAGKVWAHD